MGFIQDWKLECVDNINEILCFFDAYRSYEETLTPMKSLTLSFGEKSITFKFNFDVLEIVDEGEPGKKVLYPTLRMILQDYVPDEFKEKQENFAYLITPFRKKEDFALPFLLITTYFYRENKSLTIKVN